MEKTTAFSGKFTGGGGLTLSLCAAATFHNFSLDECEKMNFVDVPDLCLAFKVYIIQLWNANL